MPRNNRIAKEVKKYPLRLDPEQYDIIQQAAADEGIPMNTLLQKIVAEFTKGKTLNNSEQNAFEEIKNLPLDERKALIKESSINNK